MTDDGQIFISSLLKEIVLLLLRYDACSNIINGTAQIPKDVTEDDEIITMLEGMKLWDFFSSPFLFKIADGFSLLWIRRPCSQMVFDLCSCREKRDEAAGGEASGSSQRGRHLHSD